MEDKPFGSVVVAMRDEKRCITKDWRKHSDTSEIDITNKNVISSLLCLLSHA